MSAWEATFEQVLVNWQLELCIRLLREARQWATTVEEKSVVRFWDGRLAAQNGDLVRAETRYKAALDGLPSNHDTVPAIQSDLGMIYRLTGDVNQALVIHQQMQAWANVHNRPMLAAEALDQIGLDYEMQRNLTQAATHFEDALTHYERLDDEDGVASARKHLGLVQWQQGELEEAERHLAAALAIYEQQEEWYDVAQVKGNLGNIAYMRDDFDLAEYHYTNALQVFNELGVVFDKIGLLNNLGSLAVARENYREAEANFRESLALARSMGHVQGEQDALLNLVVVCRRQRRWEEVPALYLEAAGAARQLGNRQSMWNIRWRLIQFRLLKLIWQITGWLRNWVKDSDE